MWTAQRRTHLYYNRKITPCIAVKAVSYTHLGVTPTAYLLRYRASMSAQLLLDTDKSIAEICFEVGFNSQSHYGQMFRRFFHMTPREYRTRYGKRAQA